jgi:hypothetical protein
MRDLAEQSLNEMRHRNSDVPCRRDRITPQCGRLARKALKHSRSHREMNVPHIDPAVVLIRLEHFLRVHKNCATAG